MHFEFSLGKALEDEGAYEESFAHYARRTRLHRKAHPYNADENSRFVAPLQGATYAPSFFEHAQSMGSPSAEPIFIVGFRAQARRCSSRYWRAIRQSRAQSSCRICRKLRAASSDETTRLRRADSSRTGGARRRQSFERSASATSQSTRVHRKTNAPYFVDKMPNNCLYVGLIHLILPNAKIIDARRHPLGCCFSAFKQHFSRGQGFTYSSRDLGRYYREYVDLMAHIDAVLPGRVHRVFYERMIEDTETEVRRLLEYCGLPFEERCLRFYETERAVRTASSEQVRQPIFKDGMESLAAFRAVARSTQSSARGVLEAYPGAPEFSPSKALSN